MHKLTGLAALAALIVSTAGAAHATPFDFEGLTDGITSNPIVVNDGALSVTVTADGGFLAVGNPNAALLGQHAIIASFTNPLQVNQFSPIRFSFNQLINAITFNFGDGGGDDDSPVIISAFSAGNVLLGTATGSYPANDANGGSLTLNVAGASYFVAVSGTAGNNANSLYWDIGAVQAGGGGVPEPAAWAMMLVGFAGLGGVLRRRRASIATA